MLLADITFSFGGVADTDAGDGTNPAGVSVLSQTISIDETITGMSLDLNDAVHDWVGDLQITVSNSSEQLIVMGLRDGLTFNGTNRQRGNLGTGGFGASSHFSGDPDDLPTPLNYRFADGGANLDTAAVAANGGNLIDNTVVYAPSAENPTNRGSSVINSFADTFAGSSTADTWTITVVDTFELGDSGSIGNIFLNFETIAVPEPGCLALMTLAGIGLVSRRKR